MLLYKDPEQLHQHSDGHGPMEYQSPLLPQVGQQLTHPVGLAVGVEEGQSIEALIVLGEAAEAQAEGGDALLRKELALLLCPSRQPLGKGCWLP